LDNPEIEKKMKEAKEIREAAAIKKGTLKVESKNDFKDENEEEANDKKAIDSLANKGDKLAKEKDINKAQDKIARNELSIKDLAKQGKEEDIQALKDQISELNSTVKDLQGQVAKNNEIINDEKVEEEKKDAEIADLEKKAAAVEGEAAELQK
jgi:hypothetical protein